MELNDDMYECMMYVYYVCGEVEFTLVKWCTSTVQLPRLVPPALYM